MRGLAAVAAAAACAAWWAGCRGDTSAPAASVAGSAPPAALRPNVLLVSIDSLRADALGCYGYARGTSPHIDAVARRGAVFRRVTAPSPWTLPSHVSLLTGLYPHEHDVNETQETLDSKASLLTEAFRRSGYETAAVVSGVFLRRAYGYGRGFDEYDESVCDLFANEKDSHERITSPDLATRVISWLRAAERGKRPFFLFVHLWDVHYHYRPPRPYDTRFDPDYSGSADGRYFKARCDFGPGRSARDLKHVRALYDGEIAFTDQHLGRILAVLDERGWTDRTLVCITADHGDEFFEHGYAGHLRTLWREVLDVPLVLAGPGVAAGVTVDQRVSLVDVMPTLIELAGLQVPGDVSGRSLAAAARGVAPVEPRAVFAETHEHRMQHGAKRKDNRGQLVSVEEGGWKLIQRRTAPRFELLFHTATDAGEQRDVLAEEPREAARLRGLLERHYGAAARYRSGKLTDARTLHLASPYTGHEGDGDSRDDASP